MSTPFAHTPNNAQQPPAAGAPYGMGPAPSAQRPSRKKGPIILSVLGALMLLGSIAVGVILIAVGGMSIAGNHNGLQRIPGTSGSFEATADEELFLYTLNGEQVSCHVTGPGQITDGDSSMTNSITRDGQEWVSIDSFVVDTTGTYDISCEDGPVAIGPPVSVGGIFGTLGGALIIMFGGAFGALLLFVGLLWFFLARRRVR